MTRSWLLNFRGFSCYYWTRGWGRLTTRSPFDTSSPQLCPFVTCLDLFRFPHWFVKILCSWVWLISLTTCWCVLFWGGGSWLDFFYVVLLTSTDTTRRSPEVDHGHGAVTHEWGAVCDRNLLHWISGKGPWRRLWISEEIIFVFESLCHRDKPSIWSLRLDFSSMSPKFPFFFVIPTEPSIRTHRWSAEGSVEAPGSKVLPQWTLNLRVYAHTCTLTKEI